uniref:NADH dehydrogenase subunit 6 n=1 Tax=Himalopsyche malenanda TaxID=2598966 RepID=UPI0022DCDB34|nr:NADH dehydrogenase subunit 6 [Himalopsyche malenanda]UZZ44010.1 NADH dehydrogenase subunit 6 [Himalopsyche malenanda]
MMMFFTYFMLITLSMFLILMVNPISMGMLMLMQTLLLSIIIASKSQSSWFSYILFLTFLGGLLILFIYTASFSSNETFNFKFSEMTLFFTLITISFIMSIYMSLKLPHMIDNSMNLEMKEIFQQQLYFNNENKSNSIQLYSSKFNLTMMMILFLLISMTVINKISNPFFGTFRTN